MNSIRERIIREVIRRIGANAFANVSFDRIIRGELPDDYSGEQGSVLAVLEGREDYGATAGRAGQKELEVFLAFAVPLAAGEVGQTVSNNVSAELVKALSGQHDMKEGGDGVALSCIFTPVATEPNVMADSDECAMATVEFRLAYRTHTRDPFALVQ